jgi:hypothetical protein
MLLTLEEEIRQKNCLIREHRKLITKSLDAVEIDTAASTHRQSFTEIESKRGTTEHPLQCYHQ